MSLLARSFRKEVSKTKDFRMKSEEEFSIGYPTGFLPLDFLNGTLVRAKNAQDQPIEYYSVGIVDGSMNMFVGRSGCGKTTLAMQIAGEIVKPFKDGCIFQDNIEGGISDERRSRLVGMDPNTSNEKIIARNTGITAENFYERIKLIHDSKLENRADYLYDTKLFDNRGDKIFKLQPTVYILDSLALLMPEKFTDEDEMSGQMSATAAAKMNAMLFKRVVPMLKSANIILLVINHVNDSVAIKPSDMKKAQVGFLKQSETIPGGKVPVYLSNNIFYLSDGTKLKDSEGFGINGTVVNVGLIKSRTARAGRSVNLIYDPNIGFDRELSLLQLLKDQKRINGAGAHLYVGEASDHKFSQKHFKTKLKESEGFREAFTKEVQSSLMDLIVMPSIEEECIEETNSINDTILSGLI